MTQGACPATVCRHRESRCVDMLRGRERRCIVLRAACGHAGAEVPGPRARLRAAALHELGRRSETVSDSLRAASSERLRLLAAARWRVALALTSR